MEPVEINAGSYYLRQLRADDRVDDRPALVQAFADPDMRRFVPQYTVDSLAQAGDYIGKRAEGWARDKRLTWAIAEPTTGALPGEIGLKNLSAGSATGEIAIWTHPQRRREGVAAGAVDTVVRFAFGALDLRRVDYVCDEHNIASIALARRCGFTQQGTTTALDGSPSLLWSQHSS